MVLHSVSSSLYKRLGLACRVCTEAHYSKTALARRRPLQTMLTQVCGHLFTLHPSTRQLAKTLIIALRALRCLVLLNYVPSLLLGTRSLCNDRAFGALWKLMHINDFTTILYASCATTNRTRVDL